MNAVLILNRLPTTDELERDCNDCEFDTFAEDFNQSIVSGFVAEVKCVREGNTTHVEFGEGGWGWAHNPEVDWYTLKIF